MNESRRQAYLQAMGIQPYYPRVSVAGAKSSPDYEFDPQIAAITESARSVQALGVDNSRARKPASGARSARPAQVPQQPANTPVAAKPVDVVAASAGAAAQSLQFRLHYYTISPALAVIDEVPLHQSRIDPVMTLTLLKGIMQALQVEVAQDALKPELFNWPLDSSIGSSNDPVKDARNALLGYIKMRQQTSCFQHLLVFGGKISDLLLTDSQLDSQSSQPAAEDFGSPQDAIIDEPMDGGAYRITLTHSLQSMLAHPVLKREVWAHLQPLRHRLVAVPS